VSLGIVLVAAGSGTRLGLGVPKAFAPLRGEPVLVHALRGIAAASPDRIVVVAPVERLAEARSLAPDAVVVAGGSTRQASVAAGLAELPVLDVVLVHDAARCLTAPALFRAVADAVVAHDCGVVPVLPVTDTMKRVDAGGAVLGTVDRSELRHVQTPQGFPGAALAAAYAAATDDHTDDAALFAAAGGEVRTVPGDASAAKITTLDDLVRAEGAGAAPPVPALRTGIGTDVHAVDPARELWLGGLHWPGEAGLAGHSDGDAVCHAICDALLSAAGLGDIGGRFGTADPRFEHAHGDVFLTATLELLATAGCTVANVAVQIVGERPRIGTRRDELQAHLGALLGAPVSVAGTTSDGLGFTGRGEGVAAVATALVVVGEPPPAVAGGAVGPAPIGRGPGE